MLLAAGAESPCRGAVRPDVSQPVRALGAPIVLPGAGCGHPAPEGGGGEFDGLSLRTCPAPGWLLGAQGLAEDFDSLKSGILVMSPDCPKHGREHRPEGL